MIYVDLVMGLNFAVDLMLLLAANRLSGFPPGWGRAVGAAVLGAVYSGWCLIPGWIFLGGVHWRLVCLGLMGSLAFGWDRSGWKRTGLFALLTMAMGGVAMGFGRCDIWMLALSGAVVWGLCCLGLGARAECREYVNLLIPNGDVKAELLALRDTGNSLRDPLTGEPVLVIGADAARTLTGLTPEQLAQPMETMLSKPIPGLRLIPYSAVGQPGSMLLAKRFRDVRIGNWKGSVVVAFSPGNIGKGEVYQALAW